MSPSLSSRNPSKNRPWAMPETVRTVSKILEPIWQGRRRGDTVSVRHIFSRPRVRCWAADRTRLAQPWHTDRRRLTAFWQAQCPRVPYNAWQPQVANEGFGGNLCQGRKFAFAVVLGDRTTDYTDGTDRGRRCLRG